MEINERSAEYWADRVATQEKAFYKKQEALSKDLKKAYDKAAQELEGRLSSFVSRYASDKGLDYQDTLQVMDKTSRAAFKKTVAEYVEEIEKSGSKELLKELNILAGKSRFQRIDELITEIKVQADLLHVNQEGQLSLFLGDAYKENFYKTAYETQKALGIGWSFGNINPATITKALDFPWSGDNFSSRIWDNREALVKGLRQELTQGLIQGKSYKEMAAGLQKVIKSGYNKSERVMITETSYVLGESHAASFEALGVEKYQIVATLDSDTSEICRREDGKVYELKDRKVGTNAAPFHPYCRTTAIPYVDNALNERIARFGKNKKVEKISNITYKDWYSKFVV